jgi:SPP1 family predicted phage head-tail adaptor
MRSGRLRSLVEIQEKADGSPRQSASGMRLDAWAPFASVRAFIRPISGKELRAGQQVQSQIAAEIEIRYLAGVRAGMRVSHAGLYYRIEAVVNPQARNRNLLLQCSSGVAND